MNLHVTECIGVNGGSKRKQQNQDEPRKQGKTQKGMTLDHFFSRK